VIAALRHPAIVKAETHGMAGYSIIDIVPSIQCEELFRVNGGKRTARCGLMKSTQAEHAHQPCMKLMVADLPDEK
jgi:hypothetical protein